MNLSTKVQEIISQISIENIKLGDVCRTNLHLLILQKELRQPPKEILPKQLRL